MANDFEFTGFMNRQAGFKEIRTGTQFWVAADDDSPVEMGDGDAVILQQGGRRILISIRGQRPARWL